MTSDGRRVPPSCATLERTGLCFRFLFPQPSFRCELNFPPFSHSPSHLPFSLLYSRRLSRSRTSTRDLPLLEDDIVLIGLAVFSVECQGAATLTMTNGRSNPLPPLFPFFAKFRVEPGKRRDCCPRSQYLEGTSTENCLYILKIWQNGFFPAGHSAVYSLEMGLFNVQLQQHFTILVIICIIVTKSFKLKKLTITLLSYF